jgi:hypothetical protein
MDEAFFAPRMSWLVQSVNETGEEVVLEDLRTGNRRQFESLRALATAWMDPAALPTDRSPKGEST